MQISKIRTDLSKQVMHQTLKIILEYLWKSGKIIYGPKRCAMDLFKAGTLKENAG